ncbi:MAG: peptidase M16, partial [Moraxellaceae bacterium]
GHSLAMTLASAGMSPAAKLAHELGGLTGIAELKILDNQLDDEEKLIAFANGLAQIHQLILNAPMQFLIVGEDEHLNTYRKTLEKLWPSNSTTEKFVNFAIPNVSEQIKQAWLTNTQVNFCAKAYPTVPADHPDAAPLTVLGGFLRNGYLHRAIREQGGAYGGGASQDNTIAAFRFYSYRDPRLTETLDDFDASLNWLQETQHSEQSLEEAVLGVIGSIDKPGSPAGEAKTTYQAELFGRTREKREIFRNRVVKVTVSDLLRVAKQYLVADKASVGIVSHAGHQEKLQALGLQIHQL